jgi:hypothetical protein
LVNFVACGKDITEGEILLILLDFVIRRPSPKGPGRRCQDKLQLTQKMLDERWAAFAKRGVTLPAPMVVANSWFSQTPPYLVVRFQGFDLVEVILYSPFAYFGN